MVLVFGLTMLLSAFLLFQVQPLISRAILPWYGGAPHVWATCLLFFQVLLFVGYAYAHYSTRWLPRRAQGIVHCTLISLALLALPILPQAGWKPDGHTEPIQGILLLLAASVGVPYLVLAATSPLIQHWWDAAEMSGSPYPLYALSNVGSLLALISYPFVFEPLLGLSLQDTVWSGAFLVFAPAVIACGSVVWWWPRRRPEPAGPESERGSAAAGGIAGWQRVLWTSLAAVGSMMLLATTNHITHDIAVVPLLWVVPLSLYLVTFILAFTGRTYPRVAWIAAMMLVTAFIAIDQSGITKSLGNLVGIKVLRFSGVAHNYLGALALYLFAMFACCMVCHGELARLKPPPAQLTSFYLYIAFGGALGGSAVALGGPLLLTGHYELSIGMVLCWLLVLIILCNDPRGRLYGGRPAWAWSVLSMGYGLFTFTLLYHAFNHGSERIAVSRNFYGVLAVNEEDADSPDDHCFELVNGLILHGVQWNREDKRRWPTTYYGRKSGIGLAMNFTKRRQKRRIGIVGLGSGTMAAHGQTGDYLRFYEIDPDVVEFSDKYFSYLRDTPARHDIALGDARISLEQELRRAAPQEFDVLVLDAFTSDAIPVHLLTREAFGVYLQHLRDDTDRQGIIAVHISNRYLNLLPVLQSAAGWYDLDVAQVNSAADKKEHAYYTDWVLMSRPGGLRHLIEDEPTLVPADPLGNEPEWTDDFSNIWSVLE
jgi:hypothetical protein